MGELPNPRRRSLAARGELKFELELLRLATRQSWLPERWLAQLRRALAWRKDAAEAEKPRGRRLLETERLSLDDAPWRNEAASAASPKSAPSSSPIADAVRHYSQPSEAFEEFDPSIAAGHERLARVLAFYLPQFHPFPENDSWWGKGFTEWTNVARALPRFEGHYQPRTPRDLGFYDLRDDHTMRRQIEFARGAGLHGFCFYYYNFDGKRLLELPTERFLADPTLDFPFCLLWANENWTRRWDGAETEVLIGQSYDASSRAALVDDFAGHMRDPRYLRLGGRPILFVYRPNVIPDARNAIADWRRLFRERHGETPLLYMAQGFGSEDPREFGLDGAIEFPPHKIENRAAPANDGVAIYDPAMKGRIYDYRDLVAASLGFPAPDYPLIKTVFPSWDNDARRQGNGLAVTGSTPDRYGYWLERAIGYARHNPVEGEPLVFVNAWNEWAEGAYLEPDIHFGSAYLNATARAVCGLPARRPAADAAEPVLLVGHDAHPHGAQELLLNIAATLSARGVPISILLLGEGPWLARYQAIAATKVVAPEAADEALATLARRGFRMALVNSVASGPLVAPLRNRGFRVVALVHELPGVIDSHGLGPAAQGVARLADVAVFASERVRSAFEASQGTLAGAPRIRPQGLYKTIEPATDARVAVRAELGIDAAAPMIVNVGYGDRRKGLDLFVRLAATAPDRVFVWVGQTDPVLMSELGDKAQQPNLHLVGRRDDVGRLLAAADAFALTSREDPFPSVVIEALAAGLPVIGFRDAGGFADLLADPAMGGLVELEDLPAMADAIGGELARGADEKTALAVRRRNLVVERFGFDDYVDFLLATLRPVRS